jgi:dTMP kinase
MMVFQGVDRCGKSTQTAMLGKALDAELMRFPDRTTAIGIMINSYLAQGVDMDDRAVHLLFSANRWEAKANIEKTLASGKHIVCDRYAYSGVAFSGAKEGMNMEWCANSDRGLPAPDCVIYLNLSIENAMGRGEFGAERYEKEDFQRKVSANFQRFIDNNGVKDDTPWHIIDASQSIEQVHEQIKTISLETAAKVANSPIRSLFNPEQEK